MSVMEKRLQILLDRERYDRIAAEAARSGRSVAAVIRQAIDIAFPDDQAVRQAAMRAFLDSTAEPRPGEREPDWSETKRLMDAELERKLGG